jgi:hypothetical protein
MSEFTMEAPESVTTLASPKNTTAKNSGEEKLSATLATGLVSSTITTAEMMPPTKAATRDQPSASAAWPLRVIS